MEEVLHEQVKEGASSLSETEQKEVASLSDNDIKWRSKYKSKNAEFEDFKNLTQKEKEDLLSKVNLENQRRATMENQLIDAKIEAIAVSAGLRDIELVKLIDKKDIKLGENGEIVGINEAVTAFKTRKPEYFAQEKRVSTSTNSAVNTGSNVKPQSKNAWDLTKEDWKMNKSRYMSGNFT